MHQHHDLRAVHRFHRLHHPRRTGWHGRHSDNRPRRQKPPQHPRQAAWRAPRQRQACAYPPRPARLVAGAAASTGPADRRGPNGTAPCTRSSTPGTPRPIQQQQNPTPCAPGRTAALVWPANAADRPVQPGQSRSSARAPSRDTSRVRSNSARRGDITYCAAFCSATISFR